MAVHISYTILIVFSMVISPSEPSHFRGGSISWKSLNGNKVKFDTQLAWTYGNGPGCQPNLVGQYVTGASSSDTWKCLQGCTGSTTLSDTNYFCMAASQSENWEQGQKSFNHTFSNTGPFKVGFEGGDWMALTGGKGNGPWSISTTVDLRERSDTGRSNSSPYTLSKPLYYMQFNCKHTLRLPVLDPDGDRIKCRWATNTECASVCQSLPDAVLDEEACTITFSATSSYIASGVYAVALTIEDYPNEDITLAGSVVKTTTDPLSSLPLQFLITTPSFPEPCDAVPRFIDPTPADNEVLLVEAGNTFAIGMWADHGNFTTLRVQDIRVTGPVGLQTSTLQVHGTKKDTFYKTLTWPTTDSDVGEHIVCGNVDNNRGKSGTVRCFTVKVVTNPCLDNPGPCLLGSTCVHQLGNYTCVCVPGYTGVHCDTDIDDCDPNPCQNSGTCVDQVNNHACLCFPGFTGKNCLTNIDDCYPNQCKNGATCVDQVNNFTCTCPYPFSGRLCQTGYNFCSSLPCLNGGSCENTPMGYNCTCVGEWHGQTCADINRDPSNPKPPMTTSIPNMNGQNGTAQNVSWPTVNPTSSSENPHSGKKRARMCPEREYGQCKCVVSPLYTPPTPGPPRPWRDFIAGLVGFPVGLALSVVSYVLFRWLMLRYCTKQPLFIQVRPTSKIFPDRTDKWVQDQLSPVETSERSFSPPNTPCSDGSPCKSGDTTGSHATNIYRATSNDNSVFRSGRKKSVISFMSSVSDW